LPLLVLALAGTSCVRPSAATPPGAASSLATLSVALLEQAAGRYASAAVSRDPASGFPRSADGSGKWRVTSVHDWTSGFFPGTLWYLYAATGDPALRAQAERWTRPLVEIPNGSYNHDLGFQFNSSFGNAYRFTGDTAWRAPALNAARLLAGRFNPAVGAIKSWDWTGADQPYPVIADNMMNLELLFWGAEQPGGDPEWRTIALRHARTTIANHLRPDGGSFHVVVFDPTTGAVRARITNQGFADSSTWARGQAWLTYGFTMAYREVGEPEFLLTAQRVADYAIARLPADGIPCWDYQAPGCPDSTPRDASAAAITASALLELSTFIADADARRYRRTAERILASLASPAYLRPSPAEPLLAHSVGSLPGKSEVDVSLIYADYYFVEALLRWRELNAGDQFRFLRQPGYRRPSPPPPPHPPA